MPTNTPACDLTPCREQNKSGQAQEKQIQTSNTNPAKQSSNLSLFKKA